ncbi:MAG TPA: FecR domain-containing protein, partial [Duganella sp.]|nr:FecR domain-containing protein [Duganella sp.]
MSRNIIRSVVLAALAGVSTLALADPPAVVGRISAVQGQVTLVGGDDDEPVAASLNWPVTGANHVNTASGARTEFRVGSTAVRLDGDSDLEITDMDEDLLRLRLNYGSVSIRVRSPELLRDFELTTPQARVTLLEPGLVRVDVERVADTSQISV